MSEKLEPTILFVKPGAIGDGDIAVLQGLGIAVIQVKNPAEIKFTKPSLEISGNDMLVAAIKIINDRNVTGAAAREALSNAFGAVISAKTKDTP